MAKIRVKAAKPKESVGKITQIVIDSEEADDWIRSLDGYRESEAAIHEELSKQYGTGKADSQ